MNAHYESCREALIKHAAQRGLLVWIYTLPANGALLRRYVDMGVDAVSVMDVSACMEQAKRWSSDDAYSL